MKYLCDTSILIDYLNGNDDVRIKLKADGLSNLGMSSITLMELLVGAFNKREALQIRKAFQEIAVIDISEGISSLATDMIDTFAKSHGLQIPDALIAATALYYKWPLFNLKIKDFRFIPDISLIE